MKTTLNIERKGNEGLIEALLNLQREAFPAHMQIEEPEAYYAERLECPANINVLARNSQSRVTGYIVAIPHDCAVADLQRHDSAMHEDSAMMYLETIQTLPGQRRSNSLLFLRLLARVCVEAQRRDVTRFSMHARVSNGMSRMIQRVFADVARQRRLENWCGSGEAFDYLESAPRLRRKTASSH